MGFPELEAMGQILKLDPQDGDVIFVDRNAVDLVALSAHVWPPRMADFTIVAVDCEKGQSVADAIFRMPRDQASEILRGLSDETSQN